VRAWEVAEMPKKNLLLKTSKARFLRKVRFPPAFIFQRSILEHPRHVLFIQRKVGHFNHVRERHVTLNDLERVRLLRDPLTKYDVRDLLTLEI